MGGSPVPACMFAPEPGSPGGGPRIAAAACPLRAAFDSEDGEALNGEPEIDLTSKVGPAGGRAVASAIIPPGPVLPFPWLPPGPWGCPSSLLEQGRQSAQASSTATPLTAEDRGAGGPPASDRVRGGPPELPRGLELGLRSSSLAPASLVRARRAGWQSPPCRREKCGKVELRRTERAVA